MIEGSCGIRARQVIDGERAGAAERGNAHLLDGIEVHGHMPDIGEEAHLAAIGRQVHVLGHNGVYELQGVVAGLIVERVTAVTGFPGKENESAAGGTPPAGAPAAPHGHSTTHRRCPYRQTIRSLQATSAVGKFARAAIGGYNASASGLTPRPPEQCQARRAEAAFSLAMPFRQGRSLDCRPNRQSNEPAPTRTRLPAASRGEEDAPMPDSFTEFLTRLQAGDDLAAQELFERFSRQLIALALRHLEARLRRQVDPEDVVQSAYKSFFFRYGAGKLDVANWNSLWGLLTLITVRKCAERAAYHHAARRDIAREVSPPHPDEGAPWLEPFSREPTPVEAAVLSETVERLLAGLDADERPILELGLQGHTTREISERLGRAERTVRLLREGIRHRLERMQRDNV